MLALGSRACYCAAQHKRDFAMSDQNLPKDSEPLSPIGYWQESIHAWADFSRRASQIMISQAGGAKAKRGKELTPEDETLASEILRTFSDMNLRHWQNTARFLEGLPAWMQVPHNMTGSALVDWFDKYQRNLPTSEATRVEEVVEPGLVPPITLASPKGKADDLTRIKGIGPKLRARLNELGIFHFKQIADWSDTEALWVDEFLAFKGRVARENWITQARVLSANGSATVH